MIKCKCFSIFILIFFASHQLTAQVPKVQKVAEWFKKGYYILSPSLASERNEVAFSLHLSGKDSNVRSNSTLDEVWRNYITKTHTSLRQYDPLVCVYDYIENRLSLFDYGWSPAFSPNDNKIAYAFQVTPLRQHSRLYAEVYKGNSIKVFNRATASADEIVRPPFNYFLDPFFSDSSNIVYKTGEKTNGAYGAAISFSEVNPQTKKSRLLHLPAIRYRLNELMGKPYLINKRLAYTIYSPADSGVGMANNYQHLLLSGKDTLHNFGVRKFTDMNYKFASTLQNELMVLNDSEFGGEDTSFLLTFKSKRLMEKKPLQFEYAQSWLSPDGNYMMYVTLGMDMYIVNLNGFSKSKVELPKGQVHAVVWSSNGSRLAIVQSHDSYDGTDRLLVFRVK